MNEAEFDRFADQYEADLASSLAPSGERPAYFAEAKIKDIWRECSKIHRWTCDSPRILDFGAGNGGLVPFVRKHIPNAQLTCVDVSRRSLAIAERRFPSEARFVHFDGKRLPFPSEAFDIVYAACVFHHIDEVEHHSLLGELRRILARNGSLFIFEHNPYNPITLRIVKACPFDTNAKLISSNRMKNKLQTAGFNDVRIRFRIFFPHFLRFLRPFEALLKWLPLGGQYYAVARN